MAATLAVHTGRPLSEDPTVQVRTFASRSNRARRSGSPVSASGRILIATSRSSRVSSARYTSPIPPSPSLALIRKWLSVRPIKAWRFYRDVRRTRGTSQLLVTGTRVVRCTKPPVGRADRGHWNERGVERRAGPAKEVPFRLQLPIAATLALFLLTSSARSAEGSEGNPGHGMTPTLNSLTTEVTLELSNPPQPGERALCGRDLYLLGGTLDAPTPLEEPLGPNTNVCTLVTATEASCEGRWSLDGIGLITGAAYLDFTLPEPDGLGASLTGGAGAFAWAEGVIHTIPVPDTARPRSPGTLG